MKDISRFFGVLSDETRLEMLWLLFNQKEICVCDLMGVLGITQSKASRHLATMRHAGLVFDRREGPWSYYSLKAQESEPDRVFLNALRGRLARHPRAGELLDSLHRCVKCRSSSAAATRGRTR